MNRSMLITGAKMVLPNGIILGDLRITDGIISEISTEGKLQPRDGELVHDAEGLHLLPGIIDPQVHFRDPGQPEKEDLYTGSRAAASGGVTAFLDMPNNVFSHCSFAITLLVIHLISELSTSLIVFSITCEGHIKQ